MRVRPQQVQDASSWQVMMLITATMLRPAALAAVAAV
jgi:hypothetical protein